MWCDLELVSCVYVDVELIICIPGLAFSRSCIFFSPAFSSTALWSLKLEVMLVPHFRVLNFPVPHFQRHLLKVIQCNSMSAYEIRRKFNSKHMQTIYCIKNGNCATFCDFLRVTKFLQHRSFFYMNAIMNSREKSRWSMNHGSALWKPRHLPITSSFSDISVSTRRWNPRCTVHRYSEGVSYCHDKKRWTIVILNVIEM